VDILYWKVRSYLRDAKLQKTYMKNSLRLANRYTAAATTEKWRALLTSLQDQH